MRRALRIAAVAAGLAGGLAASGSAGLAGCAREARPVEAPAPAPSDEPPPLPPASGTPIGYLVDAAGELKLTDSQLSRLKEVDGDLATRLSTADSVTRSASAPLPPKDDDGKGRGLGFRAGGAGVQSGTPVSGGRQGFPGANNAPAAGSLGTAADPTRGKGDDTTTVLTVTARQRDRDLRTAMVRAFNILEPAQRPTARRVLSDRGIDPDTGQSNTGGTAEPAGGPRSGDN